MTVWRRARLLAIGEADVFERAFRAYGRGDSVTLHADYLRHARGGFLPDYVRIFLQQQDSELTRRVSLTS